MKRFIAGSRCPKCKTEDCLRVWQQKETQFMDCLHCDFKQSIDNSTDESSAKLIGIKMLDKKA